MDTHLGKSYRDVRRERPLFTLLQPLHKTPFSTYVWLPKIHFNQKSHNFPIFCSKYLNLVNLRFLLSLKICQNPVQKASLEKKKKKTFWKQHLCQKKKKNQFSKPPNLALHWSKPPFLALRAAHPYSNQTWVPPPPPQEISIWPGLWIFLLKSR